MYMDTGNKVTHLNSKTNHRKVKLNFSMKIIKHFRSDGCCFKVSKTNKPLKNKEEIKI